MITRRGVLLAGGVGLPVLSLPHFRAPNLCAAAALAGLGMLLAPTQALPQQATDVQTKVPVADFFRTPRLDRPKLSPSGRYLAGAVPDSGRRAYLWVLDLENLGQSKVVAGFDDADINNYEWVNDQRIVFDVIDLQSGSNIFNPRAPGLWAVNRDASDFRQLIHASKNFAFIVSGRSTITSGPQTALGMAVP